MEAQRPPHRRLLAINGAVLTDAGPGVADSEIAPLPYCGMGISDRGRWTGGEPQSRAWGPPQLAATSIGVVADITIFDPTHEWTYRTAGDRSKSRNSPFEGWTSNGRVTATITDGKIVYEA